VTPHLDADYPPPPGPWVEAGACRGLPTDWWFSERGHNGVHATAERAVGWMVLVSDHGWWSAHWDDATVWQTRDEAVEMWGGAVKCGWNAIIVALVHEHEHDCKQGRGVDLAVVGADDTPEHAAGAGLSVTPDCGVDGSVRHEHGDAVSEPEPDTRGVRESDPPGATPEDLAYELGWVALGEVVGDDDGCEAARAIGASLMASEEMQAIKAVLRHLAVQQARQAATPTVDVLRLLGLPDLAVEWVMS
jgi:hypothetical protein